MISEMQWNPQENAGLIKTMPPSIVQAGETKMSKQSRKKNNYKTQPLPFANNTKANVEGTLKTLHLKCDITQLQANKQASKRANTPTCTLHTPFQHHIQPALQYNAKKPRQIYCVCLFLSSLISHLSFFSFLFSLVFHHLYSVSRSMCGMKSAAFLVDNTRADNLCTKIKTRKNKQQSV